MPRPIPSFRSDYFYFAPVTTRWHDNDIYGHVNNVTYYSYFDTVANLYLIHEGGLDIHDGENVGFVVSSSCEYFSPVAFPDRLDAGLRVNKLGTSSVEYGIGIFKEGEDTAAAEGRFVHVFVERQSAKSHPIPDAIRAALERIHVPRP